MKFILFCVISDLSDNLTEMRQTGLSWKTRLDIKDISVKVSLTWDKWKWRPTQEVRMSLIAIEFFHNSHLILDEFNKIKFSKKLTCPGIEARSLAQQSGLLTIVLKCLLCLWDCKLILVQAWVTLSNLSNSLILKKPDWHFLVTQAKSYQLEKGKERTTNSGRYKCWWQNTKDEPRMLWPTCFKE